MHASRVVSHFRRIFAVTLLSIATVAHVVSPALSSESGAAPPRSIRDIQELLRAGSDTTSSNIEQARKLAAEQPPASARPGELIRFYTRRAKANESLGRFTEELADFEEAVRISNANPQDASVYTYFHAAAAQMRDGSTSRTLEYLKLAEQVNQKQGWRIAINLLRVRAHLHRGDLRGVLSTAEANERIFSNLKPNMVRWDANDRAGVTANYLQTMAEAAAAHGRYDEAESYYREAIELLESQSNLRTTVRLPVARNRLVRMLMQQRRVSEAEAESRRALIEYIENEGVNSHWTVIALTQVTIILVEQGRLAEAEIILDEIEKIANAINLPRNTWFYAEQLSRRASIALMRGRVEEAVRLYDEVYGSLRDSPDRYDAMIGIDNYRIVALALSGRSGEALPKFDPKVQALRAALGDKHLLTAMARAVRATAWTKSGRTQEALSEFADSVPILLSRSRQVANDFGQATEDRLLELILEIYIEALSQSGDAATAFEVADTIRIRAVQRALSASAARAAAKDPALADLVREEQDLVRQIGAHYQLLASLFSQPDATPEIADFLRKQIDDLRNQRGEIAAHIESQFPDYAQLVNPQPPGIPEIQGLLNDQEALIAVYLGTAQSYVWAVPKSGALAFAIVPSGEQAIAAQVRSLRRALDPKATTLGDIPEFDVAAAHQLFQTLLTPVASGWQSAKELLVVTDGPLGFLPISVLPVKAAQITADPSVFFAEYKGVDWLARSHAVTQLPSTAALAALRNLPQRKDTGEVFAGFGDPLFAEGQETQIASASDVVTRGINLRGLPINLRSLPQTEELVSADLSVLPRLPDTSEEIRSIAIALRADPATTVFLGKSASEDRIKSMDLGGTKVVAFATHGLVPGDLDGLTQPALALSSPKVVGGENDGILTMEEILGLKMNADWIVLSACNTGAGEGDGAEAVSGLGRAFFYAGARALLVSNWPVETTSARILTTDIFARQASDPNLGRAEALRQAMVALIDGPGFQDGGQTLFSYSHPIFWAPFSIIGDGGSVRS